MTQHHILIVDDEPSVRFILERTLKREDYLLETASNGLEALEKLREGDFSLMLLDLNMQPVDGMHVLSELRQLESCTVVIILTAYSSITSAVEALRLGAFDYLFKPAAPETIRRRVQEGLEQYEKSCKRANLFRQVEQLKHMLAELDTEESQASPVAAGRFLRSGKLVIDRHHRAVTLDGALLDLTTTEFNVLTCLVESQPHPLTSRQLVKAAMSYDVEEAEANKIIKWHIHHLRLKVEADPANPLFIKTVRYRGYLWGGG